MEIIKSPKQSLVQERETEREGEGERVPREYVGGDNEKRETGRKRMQKKRKRRKVFLHRERNGTDDARALLLFFTWVVSNQADNSFLNIFTGRIQLPRIYILAGNCLPTRCDIVFFHLPMNKAVVLFKCS